MTDLKKLGRYQLRRVLGKGAMGVVYEGFDPTLGRRVAVKTILRSVALDEETERSYAERFEREAKAVARLNHPHIVQVHDFGEQDEVAYLVMEFIEGRELRAFFEAQERFEPSEAVRIMGELLDALDFAHERGVVHRDVKPANVMMDTQRRVKLADFGVARIQDSDRSMAGTMVGTPAFMSPEQIKGGKIDGRTDIFSAGTILYQLLTGELPFKGDGAWTVAKKIVEVNPPPPSSLAVSVSPALDAVVRKALAKNPAQRYGKAREFAAALRGALTDPTQAPPAVPSKPQDKAETKASETELEFWRSIQNRDDLEELELYVDQFPDGAYTQLARLKIAKLRAPLEVARKAAEDQARQEAGAKAAQEAEEKARREATEKAQREADELAQREAADRARRAADEKARQEAAEKAKKEAAEKAKREADEKARRDTEEKVRQAQAQALARLKQQEEATRRAKVAADAESTVAFGGAKPPATPLAIGRKPSLTNSIVIAVIAIAAIGAYLALGRKPATEPVAQTPPPASIVVPKAEITAADIEKIKKETEERIRREYADKSAAEQAAAAKAASEKAIQEKQLALKAATEKAVAEKAAADKLVAEKAQAEKLAAAKSAAERAAIEKAAAEKAAAEKAALEKAAQDKAAAEKLVAEKAAAEKAAAAKAAAAAKPGWPSVGDRWVYDGRDADWPEKKFRLTVEVQGVTAAGVRDLTRIEGGQEFAWTHTATPQLVGGVALGVGSFMPYMRAFQELRGAEQWSQVEAVQFRSCGMTCRLSARVVGKERVTVRAGSYETWKIDVAILVPGIASGNFIFWYSEELKRTVKYQLRSRANGPTTTVQFWQVPNIDMELVTYAPAGGR